MGYDNGVSNRIIAFNLYFKLKEIYLKMGIVYPTAPDKALSFVLVVGCTGLQECSLKVPNQMANFDEHGQNISLVQLFQLCSLGKQCGENYLPLWSP